MPKKPATQTRVSRWGILQNPHILGTRKMVPRAGIEPARDVKSRGILSPLRLPVSPSRHIANRHHLFVWRRRSESNRRTRLCRPLHNHSATPPLLNARSWSGKRDSNSRPQPWQGCALPTELFPHYSSIF